MRAITMTAFRRPDYTRQVLKSLSLCKGISDWVFLPQIEPGHPDVISSFRDWNFSEILPVVNRRRLGLNENTHAAISRAYSKNVRVLVHIEDDTLLAPDALTYFQWAVDQVPRDEKILLASGYNKPTAEPQSCDSHTASLRPVFTPWGWGTNRGRINWMLKRWSFKNPKCFTCYFKKRFRQSHLEIFPSLSRIQNIGYVDGENGRTPEWYEENHKTPWFAGVLPTKKFEFSF